MFSAAFIRPVLATFVVTLAAGAVVLPEYAAEESRAVDFTTVTASDAGTGVPVGAPAAARAYAREHGLTECVDPAHARLDDVILTVPSEPRTRPVITAVGFDEALRSGELDRWNVLACLAPGSAP